MRIQRIIGSIIIVVLAVAALGPASMAAAASAPDQGCTPAFWAKSANFDQWTKFKPTDRFKDVFKRSDFGNKRLIKVIRQTGSKKRHAGRHAVAALLNASHKGIYYRMAVAGEVHTLPFEVIKFWRIWNYSQFLRNAKPANLGSCPLS